MIRNLPTVESQRRLLERLADLGDNERAQEVAKKLLSEKGIFPDLKSLDSKVGSEIFSILAESSPRAGLYAMERILMNLPRDKLLSFEAGRREMVWTLERLAWLPETFFGAGRILLVLAETENESYDNNATGIWSGLFRIHLGGTAVPAIERHILLKEALNSESVDRRILGLKGVDSALTIHESRMSSGEIQRGRLVPPEWHPKTFKEEINIRRSALELLDMALIDKDERVSTEARKVLFNSATGLFSRGMAEEILERLEKLDIASDTQRFELRETLEMILEYEKDVLTKELKSRIEKFRKKIIGDSFRDQLRNWVGRRSHLDWTEEGRKNVKEQIIKLANKAYKNPSLMIKELNWLASDKAENVWSFAWNLGKLDESKKLLTEFLKLARQRKGFVLLSGYLLGRGNAGEDEWREDFLDKLAAEEEPDLAEAVFNATWQGPSSERGAKRLLSLVESKKLDARHLRSLLFGAWTDSLPSDIIIEIINHLMQINDPLAIEAALSITSGWIKDHPEKLNEICSAAWQLIECPIAFSGGTMMSYHSGEIAKSIMHENPLRLAKAILRAFLETYRILGRDDKEIQLLKEATEKDPEKIWEEVSKILLNRSERRALYLSITLRGWYGDLFNTDFLVKWAKQHPELGPIIVANIASVGGDELSELARSLLINFQGNKRVESRLRGNFISGTFWGSEISWYESKLKNVKSWMEDLNPAIHRWVKDLEARIESELKRAKLREDEEGL